MNADSTILIAVGAEADAKHTVAAVATLFGDGARYRFAHVARPVPTPPPIAAGPAATAGVAPAGVAPNESALADDVDVVQSARDVARRAALDAGMSQATAVGLQGDPADALITEAVESGSSAIVVGAQDRSWLDQLLSRSVMSDLEQQSPVPVVVVPAPG